MAKILLKDMNTNVLPILNFGIHYGSLNGIYEDLLDTDYIDLDDYSADDIGEDEYADLVELCQEGYDGSQDFFDQVEDYAPEYIQQAFDEYGIPVSVVPGSCHWDFPRSGWVDTNMNFDMYIDAAWVEDTYTKLCTNREFTEFLSEFRSRDGFFSYMPDSIEKLSEILNPRDPEYWRAVTILARYYISQDDSIREHIELRLWEDLEGSPSYITRSSLNI